MNEMPEVSGGMNPAPKKNNNQTIIIVAVIVLLCCCCVAVGIPLGNYLWENGDALIQSLGS